MNDKVTVVILAAGLGTRMKSSHAKVLHRAGGLTLLDHVIRAASAVAPAEQIVAVIGHEAEKVRASVQTPGVRFALQTEQKGTGHAVLCARRQIKEGDGRLLILNGDGPLLKATTLKALLALGGNAIVTTELADPTGYGRIIRSRDGMVAAIVEQKSATLYQREIKEINPGVYCFDADLFWEFADEIQPNNPAKEYYLTDMVEIMTRHGHPVAPLLVEDETELLGINTRAELAVADKILRARKNTELMVSGVTIESPETVTIDADVEIAPDTTVEANVQLRGRTRVGANCHIGTGSILRDCVLADGVTLLPYVVAEASQFGAGAHIGPFARLRMNARVDDGAFIGNFVELKNTVFGAGAKANHLAYLGDATVGPNSNIGAGTITCNYDGAKKHQTQIAENVFVGSNSTLVAPLTIAEGAYIAAGSVITKDVEADALALGRARQVDKPGWAAKRRGMRKKPS